MPEHGLSFAYVVKAGRPRQGTRLDFTAMARCKCGAKREASAPFASIAVDRAVSKIATHARRAS
jgi:hypothetical protein